MENFFDINSVGVVGASESSGKLSNDILKFLKNFKGKKYGINPKGGSFQGIKFYKSISLLPQKVDILVFVIPAPFIIDSLLEAAKNGIKRAIIISAGFKEVGNYELENQVKQIIKDNDIMLLGPNCLGYVDTYKDLNLSFGTKIINKGNVSVISQSGAMAVAITDWALNNNIGFSKVISLGNKAGIDEVDLMLELYNDEKTKIIVMYLESLERGELFLEVAKKVSKHKPIIVLKSGISSLGEKAAQSHTGAISSNKDILFSALKDAGVHFTNSLEEYFLLIELFSKVNYHNIPKDLSIITNAGGPGVITTDYAEKYNIKLSKFTDKEKEVLKKGLSLSCSVSNPIDIIGDATSATYNQILENFNKLKDKRVILILLTPQSVTDVENIANTIVDYSKKNKKSYVFTSFIGGRGIEKAHIILKNNGILDFNDPEKVINGYSKIIKQINWENSKLEKVKKFKPKTKETYKLDLKNKKTGKLLSIDIVEKLFDSYNINHIKDFLISDKKDITKVFDKQNINTLVAKINSDDIPHKSDVGGIILNIKNKIEAENAYDMIIKNVKKNVPKAKINGVNFSYMITGDNNREVFVGFKRDLSFGNIMILGMGGVYVNVFEDIQIGVGLKTKKEIKQMLKELKYYPVLKGIRGVDSINFDSLIDNIYNLQFLFDNFGDIQEIDINPIICNNKESIIVDSKFYL